MTDATELPHPVLEPLETLTPVEESAAAPPPSVYGAPPPFFRSDAHSEYYRFLFAGVVMTLGCLMPFSADPHSAGYKTLEGAFYLLLSVGLIWSMWIALYSGRFRMKWVILGLIPVLALFNDFVYVERDAGVNAFKDGPVAGGWIDVITSVSPLSTPEDGVKATNFCRAFGTGRIVLFLGSLLNLLFFLTAIFGGMRHAKAKKAAVRAAAAEARAAAGDRRGR